MAVYIPVRLRNETRSGIAELRKTLTETAAASENVFQVEAAKQMRDALHGVTVELEKMTKGMQKNQEATKSIRDQAEAQKEVKAVTQQSITVIEAERTTYADVAMTGLQAYLMYQRMTAIKKTLLPLWQNHRTAMLATGAAMAGVVVTGGTLIAGYMALKGLIGLTSSAFDSMKKSSSDAADESKKSANVVDQAWASLGERVSMVLGGKQVAKEQHAVLEDIAAAIYTVRDSLPKYTITDVLFGPEGTLATRAAAEFGKFNKELSTLAQKSLYFGGSMTHSVLNSFDGLSDKIVGPEAAAMLETTRKVFTEATLQREKARTQGLENEAFFEKLANKQADAEVSARLRAIRTMKDLDRSLAQNKGDIDAAADGSEGSEKRLKSLRKERQDMETKRQELLNQQLATTERLHTLERKGHADFIKSEAEELRGIRQVEQAQQAVLNLLKKLNDQGKLDKATIDEASQRYEAYAQRKQQLLKEEADTLKAVTQINADLMKAKEDASTAAANKAAQDLRDAIKEAKGILNPEQSLTSELEGQFSDRDVTKEIIRKRQEAARNKHIGENRGRVDLEGNAWGNTDTERRANQAKFDRELRNIDNKTERDARKDIARAMRGKKSGLNEEEVVDARQQLLNDRADKAVKDLRLSPQARQALLDQQRQEREARQQQRNLQKNVGQVEGLMGSQPDGKLGAAVQSGFGSLGQLANTQSAWGQGITQSVLAANQRLDATDQKFNQLLAMLSAGGRQQRAINGSLK